MKLVIADDSEAMRDTLMRAASEIQGLEVVAQACDGATALSAVRRCKPDIAILDIRMPNGSGIDVLEHIKSEALDTTVIMFTSFNSTPYRERCLAAGADYFFTKSTQFGALIDLLHQIVGTEGKDAQNRE